MKKISNLMFVLIASAISFNAVATSNDIDVSVKTLTTNTVTSKQYQHQHQKQNQTQTATGGEGGNAVSTSQGGSGGTGGTGGIGNGGIGNGGEGGIGNGGNSQVQVQGDNFDPDYPVSSAIAPSMSPSAQCMGVATGGVQTMGFGFSVGKSYESKPCNQRELVRTLQALGQTQAALQVACSIEGAEVTTLCKGMK